MSRTVSLTLLVVQVIPLKPSPHLGEDARMLGGCVALGLPLGLLVLVIVDLVIL